MKARERERIRRAIGRILYDIWDPIGVRGAAPRDEYDSYIAGVHELLLGGSDAARVSEHLQQLEVGSMGLNLVKLTRRENAAALLVGLKLASDDGARS